MKPKTILRRMAVLVATMMCALGANADSYACYTPENTTLTFYLDDLRSSRTGTTYDLNLGNNSPGWKNDGTNANVTQVVFDPSFAYARPETTYAWFHGMQNLQSITGIRYLNTSQTTSMRYMFYGCSGLTSLDLSRFNTTNVTSMLSMFYGCSALTSLNVSSFNTANVTDIRSMFRNCTGLTSLDLGNFNTANVTSMGNMFNGCENLKTIYVGSGWSTAAVTGSGQMFLNCTKLVGDKGTTYDANHTDAAYAHIDGGTSNPGYFTEWKEAYACYTPSNTTLTFYYDNQRSSRSGTTYDLNTGNSWPDWRIDGTNASVTKVVFDPSFAAARPTTTYDWFYGMTNLQSITGMSYLNTSEVTYMAYMFYYCSGLTSLDLSSFNTAKVKYMEYMFYKSNNLQTIYVGSGWSTAAVTYSINMFTNCTSLVGGQGTTYDDEYVDATYARIDGGTSNPGYFTEKPEAYACYTESNTTLTFYYDNYRSSRTGTTYDLNTGSTDVAWDTDGTNASVTKVVFDPSFAGARPTTTYDWFYDMTNLQSITGLSYLNTSEVTKMGHMFNSCYRLTSLDLSGFNTSRVTTMNCMFFDCRNLQTIYVGTGWSTAAVTNSDNMFSFCTSLVGGQGTTYNASNPKDKTYAHIDGGPSNPGYLTAATMPYACYTPENTTLTFYYDDQHGSRTGTTYALNAGDDRPDWYNDNTRTSVTEVVFDPSFASARPTTTYSWFSDMGALYSIKGLAYLNTSAVTNMSRMFTNCAQLTSLDLTSFTTAKVTDMSHMFDGCWALKGIDLFSFNTAKVTDMSSMFYGCYYLTTIYVGTNWTTSAVTRSTNMFKYCYELVGGNGTVYDESHTDAAYALIDGYVGTGYLTVPIDHNKAPYACHNTSDMILTFYYDRMRGFHTETTYDLNTEDNRPGWYSWRTSVRKVVFDPSFSNASPECTYSWFGGMVNLQSIEGMSNLRTDWVTNMAGMFNGCSKLSSIDLSNFRTPNATVMGSMFMDCSALTSLDLSTFNTAKVTNMFQMFRGCSNLQTIIVGKDWTTDAVTRSEDMFRDCTKLVGGKGTTYNNNKRDKAYAHLDYGTSNPGYLTAMVEGYVCHTSSNTTLTFYYDNQRYYRTGTMYDLNKGYDNPDWINLGTVTRVVFDPSFADARPSTTSHWFADMRTIQSITGLNYLNTSNVNHMEYMFYDCTSLETLDLTSFNTAHVVNMEYMFYNCKKLKTIFVSDDWDTHRVAVSSYMFANSTNLVGGQGTAYNDSNPKDKTYAHIDYGSSNPGYFTYAAPGVVTHIEEVPAKANTVKGIYTLDGRKLNDLPTQKGIYIIDGRRVVIK